MRRQHEDVKILVVVIACLLAACSVAQQDLAPAALVSSSSACLRANNCSVCMESGYSCVWCSMKNFKKSRCNTRQSLVADGCSSTDMVEEVTTYAPVKNLPLTDGSTTKETIQLAPQELRIKLRPNQPYTFTMQFRLAKDYPVDLYYLMDLSQSMLDDKVKVSSLGITLANEMRTISKNVRLGFGSFVDKVATPYVSMLSAQLLHPCTGCEGPYSFRNRLSLTEDIYQFADKVNATPVSGNQDSPEGGFDAIVQAIACDEIGWRNDSRKMLLFSTDASFHTAGDGKLGGIVEPNDGRCHMSNNEYTWGTLQDYPSISQVGRIIKEHRINVIFAVTNDQLDRYQDLSGFLDGSVAGVLNNDSSNVVQLVKDNYQRITSKVEMKTRGLDIDSGLKVTMRSTCGSTAAGAASVGGACDKLRPGQLVTFDIELLAGSCKGKRQWSENFDIYPVGLSESLKLSVDVICDCSCKDTVTKSPDCNGTGTYQCGVCSCDPNFDGEHCECNLKELRLDSRTLETACTQPNTTTALGAASKCTNRGDCLCGKCRCGCRGGTEYMGDACERYEGQWCQCDVYNCERGDDNKLCSGNGDCACDEPTGKVSCKCHSGYNGTRCDCALSSDGCRASNSQELCSGHGTCTCGRCECIPDELGNYYRGTHCEDCATCDGKCNEFKSCVQCRVFKTGEHSKEMCLQKCNHTFVLVDEIPPSEKYKCTAIDEQDCKFEYSYGYRRLGYTITVKQVRDCPKEVNILAVVLGVIGGILFLGIAALLVWKLVTTIHDRREFARFEEERRNAKWDTGENPIYVKATSTFKNPTYAGSSKGN